MAAIAPRGHNALAHLAAANGVPTVDEVPAEDEVPRVAPLLVAALAVGATAGLVPVMPAQAQTRTLPDFTDLVEQVGP